jgi:hypothetical protein
VDFLDELLDLSGSNVEKETHFRSHFEQFRSATYSQSRYRYLFQSHSSEISNSLLMSWNNCMAQFYATWVAQKGVVASVSPLGNFSQFVVTLDVRPALLGSVKILGLEPTTAVACRYANDRLVEPGTTMINTAAFTMTCVKDPSLSIPFVVNTEAGRSDAITVPAASSKIAELTRLVEELRVQLAELRDSNAREHQSIVASIPNAVELRNGAMAPSARPGNWFFANEQATCGGNRVMYAIMGGASAPGQHVVVCADIVLKRP